MQVVFVVQHVHRFDNDKDVKFIGVYASLAEAEAACARLRKQPGFMDTPEGFEIGEYPLGKDHWIEGYISADEALRDFEA